MAIEEVEAEAEEGTDLQVAPRASNATRKGILLEIVPQTRAATVELLTRDREDTTTMATTLGEEMTMKAVVTTTTRKLELMTQLGVLINNLKALLRILGVTLHLILQQQAGVASTNSHQMSHNSRFGETHLHTSNRMKTIKQLGATTVALVEDGDSHINSDRQGNEVNQMIVVYLSLC